jgi:hypothetical protein
VSARKERDEAATTDLCRRAMATFYAAGNEQFVADCVHGLVMMWLDERVFDGGDADIARATQVLARLAGRMRRARERRGLDPTVVDADPEAQARGRAYLDAELARIAAADPGPYVCPGCYAVDAACEPGCPDAEAEDEREDELARERLDRGWNDDGTDDEAAR